MLSPHRPVETRVYLALPPAWPTLDLGQLQELDRAEGGDPFQR